MEFIWGFYFKAFACLICAFLQFLRDGASAESPPVFVDHCSPNPCQNQAICRARDDGYSCFCVPGFQGSHCQIDVNECVSQPCKNEGTCVDRIGRFSCLCEPGFTGPTCEFQIDSCRSQPCRHGGRCSNDGGGYACACLPGFQGRQCEINTNECQEQPCQNGAECIDGVNEYSCDCSHTAFTGPNCEVARLSCASQPCFNSAICEENQGSYTCACWPGFEGRHCEIDIPECSSSPCLHGGSCIERSWQALYGMEPLLPRHYNHQQASGYVCSCLGGTRGTLCQEVINSCEPSPCQNGGRCETQEDGYSCHCVQPPGTDRLYGGVSCEVHLVGCEDHGCQNGGSCSPFLMGPTHGYTCTCVAGFTGPLCTTPTTFSFERSGYLLLHSPVVEEEFACNITLSFKTVLPRVLLFQRSAGGLLLSMELEAGLLQLTLRWEATAAENRSQVVQLSQNLTDGEWHTVQAVLVNWVLRLDLLGHTGTCGSESCHKVAPVEAALVGLVASPQNTFIGGTIEDSNGPGGHPTLPAFIGCMRDVFVDWQLVVPEEWLSDSAVNVFPGCSHRDRCQEAPCQNRGKCVNLWQSYQCQCPRPYEGHDCEEEYVAARFGNEDTSSHAEFAITEELGQNFSVSVFLRTRKPSGLLLALASGSYRYLLLWLEEGRVTVRFQNSSGLKAAGMLHDGEVHFVKVEVEDSRMTLYVAGEKQGDVEVNAVDTQAGGKVHVGGFPERTATSPFGGYFKGCMQDLRVNDRRLQFFGLDTSVRSYPLEFMDNVTAGCSGDNICSRNPCLNGGMCFSKWDDYSCSCPPRTVGRRCEVVKWCELSPCPADAECRVVQDGYECYSNATFLNDSTVLWFRGNGSISRNLTSLALSVRTRRRNAAILHAERNSSFITLSVQDGLLVMELQSTSQQASEAQEGLREGEGLSVVSLSSRRSVSDGEWHAVRLFMTAPWSLSSKWTLVLDEEIDKAVISRSHGGNLNFLKEEVDIFLGGLAPDAGWSLAGCLSTVELGGIALPYFRSPDVNLPRLQAEQFYQVSPEPALPGCEGAPVCQPNPCLNGGECSDLFNSYSCSCAEAWEGRRCDILTDTCASNPCRHGNCSIVGVNYECTCELGYTGIDCEERADVCEGHLCANGGICLHGPQSYACLCAENYTGPLCTERIEEVPWYIVVKNVKPKPPVSVCGDDTRNYTCFNGGNCTDRELSCDCPEGFIGHRCEQEVDECKSNPCLNGGYCRNLINKFICVCDMSFAGDTCQTDVSDIYFYVALLLWQNLFQLLSYLILRLDDGPEVDWGANE